MDFLLRYMGVMVSGFCVGLAGGPDNMVSSLLLSGVATLAITISQLYMYEKGRKAEDL